MGFAVSKGAQIQQPGCSLRDSPSPSVFLLNITTSALALAFSFSKTAPQKSTFPLLIPSDPSPHLPVPLPLLPLEREDHVPAPHISSRSFSSSFGNHSERGVCPPAVSDNKQKEERRKTFEQKTEKSGTGKLKEKKLKRSQIEGGKKKHKGTSMLF
jgi:hypothetical protein